MINAYTQPMMSLWLVVGEATQPAVEAVHASGGSSSALVNNLVVFVLSMILGWVLITKVPPTLHTPLMSGSNAISGITIVGSIVCAGRFGGGASTLAAIIGTLAVICAMVNVAGGYDVTNTMLRMFKKN